jgi:HSP20 family protein
MRLVRYTYPNYRTFTPAVRSFSRPSWPGLESELDRLLENTFSQFGTSTQFPVDLFEDKENTYVRAELPGVNRDDINVEVVDGDLTITATRKTPAKEGQEEKSSSFTRSVTLSDDVQTDKVGAAYENGVLTVTLPKREEAKPRKVAVQVK